jgi:hypothetical protein
MSILTRRALIQSREIVGNTRASLGVSNDARISFRATSSSFTTHFTIVFNAITITLLAFT